MRTTSRTIVTAVSLLVAGLSLSGCYWGHPGHDSDRGHQGGGGQGGGGHGGGDHGDGGRGPGQ